MGDKSIVASNEELTAEQEKQLEEEVQKSKDLKDEGNPDNILVRGALLRCSCGTHLRRLNLPKSCGVNILDNKHPKVHKLSNIVGDENNIAYYGVCKSDTPPASETICLEPYITPEGKKTSNEKVTGKKCVPIIMGNWIDDKEDELIFDIDLGENVPGITMNSFLVCKNGGIIQPVRSGQEYNEE